MTSSISHNSVNPSEVGWQFVPQYYTFVNKEPHRLHCFYNKNSTFIHGTEGEDGKPCYGQVEIHQKISSLDFEDCKVFINSVDAQSSANGGIIIQVIGEMANRNEVWRKFVQTFFLAEQPNGYFVLNDIFRFLKEESIDGDDASEAAEPETAPAHPVQEQQPVQPVSVPEPVYEPPREPTPPPAPAPAVEPVPVAPAVVDEAPTNDVAEPIITQTPTPAPEEQPLPASIKTNGIHTPEPEKLTPAPPPAAALPEPTPQPTPTPQQPPAQQQTTPTPAAPPAQTRPPPPAAAPTPAAPSAPKSWATLAATNSKKWGSAVAQESRGTTETLSAPGSGAQTPVSQTPTQQAPAQRPAQGGSGPRNEHPLFIAAQSVSTAQCFVKGVTEPITQQQLQSTLQRFGQIKDLEIVRQKACAFIEFVSVDSAKRAIVASLNHNQGGEGGVYVDVGGEAGQIRINVETKKERGDRPPAGRRGGAPPTVNGEGRGGHGQGQQGGNYRGRGGSSNRGRGGASGGKQ